MAARVARGPELLDQALEGDVTVGEGVAHGLAGLLQDVAEGRTRSEPHAERQVLDERPHGPLELATVAAGQRCAHRQVGLSGGPEKNRVVGRKKEDEGRGRELPAAPADVSGELFGECAGVAISSLVPDGGTGPVGRHLDHREVRQPVSPAGQLALQGLVRQPPPLLCGELPVLDPDAR